MIPGLGRTVRSWWNLPRWWFSLNGLYTTQRFFDPGSPRPGGYVNSLRTWSHGPVEIVDLPSYKMVIFHSYVAIYQRVYLLWRYGISVDACWGEIPAGSSVFLLLLRVTRETLLALLVLAWRNIRWGVTPGSKKVGSLAENTLGAPKFLVFG